MTACIDITTLPADTLTVAGGGTLTLEVGRRYVDREGQLRGPVEANASRLYPFIFEGTRTRSAEGFTLERRRDNPGDLIALAPEETPTPAPQPDHGWRPLEDMTEADGPFVVWLPRASEPKRFIYKRKADGTLIFYAESFWQPAIPKTPGTLARPIGPNPHPAFAVDGTTFTAGGQRLDVSALDDAGREALRALLGGGA